MSVPHGGNLLILPLAALANPFAERAKAPAPCQQSHQAQRSPTATSPVEGARARAGPSIRMLLSSCAHQHRQRMPVALQGAREGREVPSWEDMWGLAWQRVPPGCYSWAQTNGQCCITCTQPCQPPGSLFSRATRLDDTIWLRMTDPCWLFLISLFTPRCLQVVSLFVSSAAVSANTLRPPAEQSVPDIAAPAITAR